MFILFINNFINRKIDVKINYVYGSLSTIFKNDSFLCEWSGKYTSTIRTAYSSYIIMELNRILNLKRDLIIIILNNFIYIIKPITNIIIDYLGGNI